MLTRRPTRATLFSSRSYQARCRDPLRDGLEGGNRTFTIQGWGNLHNSIGGSQQTTELHHNGMWLRGDLFRIGHNAPKSNKIHKGLMGESNILWWKCRSGPPLPN